MAQTLEHQVKIRADTSSLKQAQAEMKKTGQSMSDVATAGAGMTMVMTGMSGALRGNIGALLQVAMGAGAVWKSFAQLNPILRLLTIALGAAQIVYSIFSRRSEEAAKKTEDATRAVKELGLELSAMDRHNRAVADSAKAFERIERAAERSAKAIRDMTAAQLAFNQASGAASMANIDLREAEELAGATTDEQRREIRGRFAVERNETQKKTAESDFDIKFRAHEQERTRIEEDANRQEDDERTRLTGNIDDAESRVADQVKSFASTIVSKEDFSHLPMSQRWRARGQREKEIEAEFAEDPARAAQKYGANAPGEKLNELGGLIKALESHQAALASFEESAPERAESIENALAEHAVKGQAIGLERNAALDAADAGLVQTQTALSAEEKDAQKRREAEEKARADRVRSARDRASDTVNADRYNQMADPQKATHMRDQVQEIQAALRINQKAIGNETDPDKRADLQIRQGQLVEELVAARQEGRSVVGRIEKDDADKANSASKRQEQIAEHQEAIEGIRNQRSTTAVDTLGVFEHMRSVKAGQNPDERIAEATRKMEEHTAAIAKIMQEANQ